MFSVQRLNTVTSPGHHTGPRRFHAWTRITASSLFLVASLSQSVPAPVPQGKRLPTPRKTAFAYAGHALQGFDMRVWISNQMTIGLQAWDCTSGDCIPEEPHIGLEYPGGSGIEHVYGGGPWISGIVDGARRIVKGYGGNTVVKGFRPDPRHPLRERIWRTAVGDSLVEPNRRGCDDDGDGLVDEDDLDGLDNDGDWIAATDDVGSDGIADPDEVGCRGGYDAVTNPDPAFDNFDPASTDLCTPDQRGYFNLKGDPDRYTERNGIPDHGEPHVDEDYGAVSDNDLYCSARDDVDTVAGQSPLGIKVVQKMYAWKDPAYGAIIPFDVYFINDGAKTISDVYLTYFMDADVGPVSSGAYYQRNYSCYFDSLQTAYVQNPIDRGSTPIGLSLLAAPRPLNELKFIYQWFNFTTKPLPGDSDLYCWISGGCIYPPWPVATCESPTNPSDTRFMFSFGPFDTFAPGETLKVTMSLLSGSGVDAGPDNLKENTERARILYQRMQSSAGTPIRVSPPSPQLRFSKGEGSVKLEWGAAGGGLDAADPRLYWDIASRNAETFPDDHWRRIDPPCDLNGDLSGCSALPCDSAGRLPGGRIFEGYRLYRSEDESMVPPNGSFTFIREFDDPTDGFGHDVGLDTVFVDSNLRAGHAYWYAVTSFGIPEITIIARPTPWGDVQYDTITSPGYESSIRENMVRVDLSFRTSDRFGEVKVVPNPYRVTEDYTTTGGGYEGSAYDWTDYKRKIRFIHLPRKCTIRIFTVTGDVIATLNYESPASDPDEGYLDWRLVSESKRPIASGLYVYTVESEFGTQYGKFVVIR